MSEAILGSIRIAAVKSSSAKPGVRQDAISEEQAGFHPDRAGQSGPGEQALACSLVYGTHVCDDGGALRRHHRRVKYSNRAILGAAVVGACLVSSASRADEVPSDSVHGPRMWEVSAGAGILLPTEVRAHLRTDTDASASFHADATMPGPLLEYGVYLREARLVSSETGGTASLFTFGALAKYELRLRRWCILRAGLLVGLHDLATDTIDTAIGLDLGATLEWAAEMAPHVRLRFAAQGTSMIAGGTPSDQMAVGFRPTVAIMLGVEYAFRP